ARRAALRPLPPRGEVPVRSDGRSAGGGGDAGRGGARRDRGPARTPDRGTDRAAAAGRSGWRPLLVRAARLGRVRGLRRAGVTGGGRLEVKLDIAARGVRIDGSARALVPESEPLPQALELVVGDDAHVSAPVDAAGTAPAPLLLIGEAGRYYL